MKKMYMKRVALFMGLAAMVTPAAMADGTWRNVNADYLKNPAFIPGWSGALTGTADGVGEAWDAPFEVYQVVKDAPKGEYTLTANAFYRYGTNDYAAANMKDGANHYAVIYLGTATQAVEGLFDKGQTRPGEGEAFDAAKHSPNGMGEANTSFAAGNYVNTVKFSHEGGDLRLGIKLGAYRQDQWCCFDNFKLVGPDGEVALPNGDFAEGLNFSTADNANVWDMVNVANSPKTPDCNKEGGANGCYRKTNASPYNFGQLVDLPAGKYRFGVQSFFRHGNGNESGKYVKLKGFEIIEGESAYDLHVAGKEDAAHSPLLYVGQDEEYKPLSKEDAEAILEAGKLYKEAPVMCIFDEKLDVYPDNEPKTETVEEGKHGYADSGYENEAAEVFVNNPDLYRNYVEFELAAPAKVWVGLKKDVNAPTHYWNPFRDFTLEKYEGDGSGISAIEAADENAPVEYYNLQGVRVANPENGLYIVKQGKKVAKKIFK